MIPFCKTTLGEEEKKAISDCIDSGWVVLGKKSEEFENKFAEYVGAKYAVFVDSGTSALFLAIKCIDNFLPNWTLGRIVVPSLTFTSTAEVTIQTGHYPYFEDIDRNTFCLEGTTFLGDGIPVHLLGNKSSIKARIYDSAHRIEKGDVKNSDALWCYSFYATKNMTTVQGGMIATNNKEQYEWLKSARDHGLDLGTKERYTEKYKQYDVKFIGWRVKGDDLRAVIGLEQLRKLPWMTYRRNVIVARYNAKLGLSRVGNHVYPILVNDREQFMDFMYKNGIQTTIHFRPLHQMTGYQNYYLGQSLPNTEYLGERICSIPLYPTLTDKEVEYIADMVEKSGYLIQE